MLWKLLNRNDKVVIRHLYCPNCKGPLGKGKEIERECPCKAYGPDNQDNKPSYFLQINLIAQLNKIFRVPNIYRLLEYRFWRAKENVNAIEDIYDGESYRQLCLPGKFLSNADNFSFSLNTDGCQVSKSSKASA